MTRPAVILTDIEGTTTPIAFVRDTLFPFARAALPDLLANHADDPEVAPHLAEVRRLALGQAPLDALLGWMDQDAKVTPLKALQGVVWRHGYEDGRLRADLYPDVAPALRSWAVSGIRLGVYSSGSEEAQRLIFGHSPDGDLRRLFSSFFDTRVGGKREAESYGRIAATLGQTPGEVLFLSDVEAELDAAQAAGMRTWQVVRPQDGTIPSRRHPVAASFRDIVAG